MQPERPRHYAVQVLADDDWADAYVGEDRAEVERVWQRIMEMGIKGRARLVEVETLHVTAESRPT